MYSKIMTCVLEGLQGYAIEVEADIARGLQAFNIVGLPDISIKESKERVRSAITNSGYTFPIGRITINLAPANLKKEGSQLDISIAVAILTAFGVVYNVPSKDIAFIGELSLDGRIMSIQGALPMAISLKELGFKKVIVPDDNKEECSLVKGIEIIPVKNLKDLVDYLNNELKIENYNDEIFTLENLNPSYNVDFSEIKGQEKLKRAMEIAAAGEHNLIMIGPPGAGKTMAAMRLPTILPPLNFEEAIECTKIYSVSGNLRENKLIMERPFRAPHHSSSSVAIIGGGRIPMPGEISLAHNGALFLDELPEFNKSTIEVLRQPLEEKNITISRANATLTYPANFIFIAGMNPCPCGYYGDETHECNCTLPQIQKYLAKVSRPILDRIDIHIEVEPVKLEKLTSNEETENSENIRNRVVNARNIQAKRYRKEKIKTNGQMNNRLIKKYIKLNNELNIILEKAYDKYKFSARTINKILKLSRTIADLDNKDNITANHLLEAIRYRTVDSKYWG
ncbi:YifB family Mg chelatase-like AAA ATPase [Miniphocaeibacter halophilus]|uniref:YifB family Mg chelatase-like AAA ATPase n=1 Tax=Miniphocaeibacter halophilus TaxID=2931922 RepID=A0AC61MSY6_9FIRM|nr:YifB family Mg chelatase-like AAA ATPase [Miniphocaeibacter halophilus]QQK08612.1 YifB family Mg chelatase-like AAA ATPase [Miniphocaeibacter halophilus]